ncbi:hypothetical protein VNO77_02798 [Canavalia gladiata]|uniref:Uncharacterized protein n=1 Tax=Canavalia gladiata TaxID=3824 RepID=A0AAN9R3C0_CANGL
MVQTLKLTLLLLQVVKTYKRKLLMQKLDGELNRYQLLVMDTKLIQGNQWQNTKLGLLRRNVEPNAIVGHQILGYVQGHWDLTTVVNLLMIGNCCCYDKN